MNWKRASEITEPGALQVRASDRLYVVNASIAREGWFLERWAKNIFLYGPIEPPEMEGKK